MVDIKDVGTFASLLAIPIGLYAAFWAQKTGLLMTERSDVQWEVRTHPGHPGKFAVANRGKDTAHDVEIDVWTETERAPTAWIKKLQPEKFIGIILEEREKSGPSPVDLPPSVIPDPGETPPSEKADTYDGLLDNLYSSMDTEWQHAKDLYEQSQAIREKLRRDAESEQVMVRIIWRSKRGVWAEHETRTG